MKNVKPLVTKEYLSLIAILESNNTVHYFPKIETFFTRYQSKIGK